MKYSVKIDFFFRHKSFYTFVIKINSEMMMSGFQASILLLTKCENVLIYFPNEPHLDDFINVPFMIKIVWWVFFLMLCISPDSETSFTGICSFSAELGRTSLCVQQEFLQEGDT